MPISPVGALVRGMDYQLAFAWFQICRVLANRAPVTVTIEDRLGGKFDDVTIEWGDGFRELFQVKSSNYVGTAVDEDWLTEAKEGGSCILQHFYDTFAKQHGMPGKFELTLVTNRGFDHRHPLFAIIDNLTSKISRSKIDEAGPRSGISKQLEKWQDHLQIDRDELLGFLDTVYWKSEGSESTYHERALPYMQLNGMREDDTAVSQGIELVRLWVKTTREPRTNIELREMVKEAGLLNDSSDAIYSGGRARRKYLRLGVFAIDGPPPDLKVDLLVDLQQYYPGESPRSRTHRPQPVPNDDPMEEDLERAFAGLGERAPRRVQVLGHMRLPLYFAVGSGLPRVRGWDLYVEQRQDMWSTQCIPTTTVQPSVVDQIHDSKGSDLAVGIALASDLETDLGRYIQSASLPVSRTIIFGPSEETPPGQYAVQSEEWLAAWIAATRAEIIKAAPGHERIHLFMSAPQTAALFLGHAWNGMGPTTVYDFGNGTYWHALRVP